MDFSLYQMSWFLLLLSSSSCPKPIDNKLLTHRNPMWNSRRDEKPQKTYPRTLFSYIGWISSRISTSWGRGWDTVNIGHIHEFRHSLVRCHRSTESSAHTTNKSLASCHQTEVFWDNLRGEWTRALIETIASCSDCRWRQGGRWR